MTSQHHIVACRVVGSAFMPVYCSNMSSRDPFRLTTRACEKLSTIKWTSRSQFDKSQALRCCIVLLEVAVVVIEVS